MPVGIGAQCTYLTYSTSEIASTCYSSVVCLVMAKLLEELWNMPLNR